MSHVIFEACFYSKSISCLSEIQVDLVFCIISPNFVHYIYYMLDFEKEEDVQCILEEFPSKMDKIKCWVLK